jgi:glycosyltransferase involved in cell wall biosynthesis
MDLVAITDHNTIAGALEIAHRPDVVVGVEVTTWFPEDRVPLHVLVWGVDEAAWSDLDRAREDVHDLVGELAARDLPHALAHPLHRVGGALTADHIERCLLLFPVWEGLNGARPRTTNEVAVRIAASAHRPYLERLAEKHGVVPRGSGPPALTGGSDDHSSYDVACAWTATPPAATPEALLEHLRAGRTRPGGIHGTATRLAHSVGSLGLKAWLDRGAAGLPDGVAGALADVLRHPSPPGPEGGAGRPGGGRSLRRLREDAGLARRWLSVQRLPDGPERTHARIRLAAEWAHRRALLSALRPSGLRIDRLGTVLESLVAAAAAAAPYLMAAGYSAGEERFAASVEEEFFGEPLRGEAPPAALMLTDTFEELNGVAGTMRRLAAWAAARPGRGIRVVTCGAGGGGAGHADLRPLAGVPVPAYGDAAWRLGAPSLLDLLDLVEGSGARIVHAATPGPLGLAGLLVARALGLPFYTTHHTELGAYAMELTGDRLAAGAAGAAVRWFERQADRVYVPTRATGRRLVEDGLGPERLFTFGRGIDTDLFAPGRASRAGRRRLGGARGAVQVLYVGRLSREKGMPLLVDAFRRAAARCPELHLAVVGDGPARGKLARGLEGSPHRLVGPLRGTALAEAYASADVFVLPSSTETFGQVVGEAAAAGCPPVVLDRGAACESVDHELTGLVCPADDPDALAGALVRLGRDPALRARLGDCARARALTRPGWDRVFEDLVAGYAAGTASPARSPQPSSALDSAGPPA